MGGASGTMGQKVNFDHAARRKLLQTNKKHHSLHASSTINLFVTCHWCFRQRFSAIRSIPRARPPDVLHRPASGWLATIASGVVLEPDLFTATRRRRLNLNIVKSHLSKNQIWSPFTWYSQIGYPLNQIASSIPDFSNSKQ